MLTEDELKEFFSDEVGVDTSDIAAETLLFSSGIIDSFALVNLMIFLEGKGGFRIAPTDVNLENLDSIERIIGYYERMSAQ